MKLVENRPKTKNRKMANKGMEFENEVKKANEYYLRIGKALVQKISTPWKVTRVGARIVSAFPESKSTLDFRGTVKGGLSISFDCKESEDERGLPLNHIEPHQIQYMLNALKVNETTFILCSMKAINKRFYISAKDVISYWNYWQQHKGKRGINFIPLEDMQELYFDENGYLDYLKALEVEE